MDHPIIIIIMGIIFFTIGLPILINDIIRIFGN